MSCRPCSQIPKTGELIKGTYQLLITGTTFEPDSDIDAEFVFHGQVYGLAGTDQHRRDLIVPLLWGTPIALAFGLLASLGTSVLTMVIAAIGTWYGGWVDELIQRITEINLVLPFLSILIMIGTFYSRSIWVILGATILLSIFTGAIKSYRSIFMQVERIDVHRGGPCLWRQQSADHLPVPDPAHDPAADPGPGLLGSGLCLPGGLPGGAWAWATRSCPPGARSSRMPMPTARSIEGYYYWILEPAVLLMITGLGLCHAWVCTRPCLQSRD